ncbi:chemotaxis protein CheB [Falsiroseomonas selenitidurans]|uniref:protein-glutamate methylesterase n=1 Tax=Falsiroseomonas selenitidurans TaxID=2716335 RepID=A0ABX1EBL6_9PROT|nr:chemotaxis protein CheB [Falsiroseomonas selenitidurans]NKC34625.1 response regulator [Falsiroseomonas selenitidurans]
MIRVLVVDDSGFMRMALRRIIEAEGDLRVVGEAADGEAAIEQAAKLRPDVIAMDVEMPKLDGLEATRKIMALPDPPAVLMVSHHTSDGSASALAALDRGAVDYLHKDGDLGGVDLSMLDRELRGRLRHWAGQRASVRPAARGAAPVRVVRASGGCDVVVVGASTGGPDALAAFLAAAGRLPVPCVVAQHMPAELAPDLAQHLARLSGVPVGVGRAGQRLMGGEVAVIPGGTDGHLARGAGVAEAGLVLRLASGPAAVHPSVDLLFQSAALVARRALGVVLTGMGRDGSLGARAMQDRGMPVLAQSPASCVVAGMPGALIEAGLALETADPAGLGRRVAALAQEKLP